MHKIFERITDDIDTLRRYWYTRGRWDINGHKLRYDACTDIPLAVLQLLHEFEADCRSRYFMCDHEDDLAKLWPLILEGTALVPEDDPIAWQAWLHKVADILPRLWD